MAMNDTQRHAQAVTAPRLAPKYKVLLHNDELHSMEFVVETLVKCVPELTVDIATMVMFEAHNTGHGIVTVCPLAEAEIYRDRLLSYTLGSSIEQA